MADPITLGAALVIIGDIVRLFPDYDQRKMKAYTNLLRAYEIQKTLPFDSPEYSSDILFNLKRELSVSILEIKGDLEAKK